MQARYSLGTLVISCYGVGLGGGEGRVELELSGEIY